MSEIDVKLGQDPDQAEEEPLDQLPVAYLETDERGVITRANRVACEIYASGQEGVVGSLVWDLLPADQVAASRESFLSFMRSNGEGGPVRRDLYTRSGDYRSYEVHRSVLRSADGRPAGARFLAFEVTAAQAAQEKAVRERAWFESVVASLPEAVIVLDALGYVRYMNAAGERLTGWHASELTGQVIEKGIPILAYRPYDRVVLNHRDRLERHCRGRAIVLDRKRYQIEVEMDTSPMVNSDGGFTDGVVVQLRPVNDAGKEEARGTERLTD